MIVDFGSAFETTSQPAREIVSPFSVSTPTAARPFSMTIFVYLSCPLRIVAPLSRAASGPALQHTVLIPPAGLRSWRRVNPRHSDTNTSGSYSVTVVPRCVPSHCVKTQLRHVNNIAVETFDEFIEAY